MNWPDSEPSAAAPRRWKWKSFGQSDRQERNSDLWKRAAQLLQDFRRDLFDWPKMERIWRRRRRKLPRNRVHSLWHFRGFLKSLPASMNLNRMRTPDLLQLVNIAWAHLHSLHGSPTQTRNYLCRQILSQTLIWYLHSWMNKYWHKSH